jgi:hypothetical protein
MDRNSCEAYVTLMAGSTHRNFIASATSLESRGRASAGEASRSVTCRYSCMQSQPQASSVHDRFETVVPFLMQVPCQHGKGEGMEGRCIGYP